MHLSYGLRLPTDARHVPVVRRLVSATLAELGATSDSVADVALAVGEACANAAQHAATDEDFEVLVDVVGATCRIQVTDRGIGVGAGVAGPRRDGRTSPDDAFDPLLPATHGRGFALMALLVDQLDFSPDDGGTTVVLTKRLQLQPGSVLAAGPA